MSAPGFTQPQPVARGKASTQKALPLAKPAPVAKPAPRAKPAPVAKAPPMPKAPAPKMLQPPRAPTPQPTPQPTPKLPYGGPITVPGLNPGVNPQPGFGPAPLPGLPPAQNNGPDFDSWLQKTLGAVNGTVDFDTYFKQNPGQSIMSLRDQWRAQYPNASELPPGVEIGYGREGQEPLTGSVNVPTPGQPVQGMPTPGVPGTKGGFDDYMKQNLGQFTQYFGGNPGAGNPSMGTGMLNANEAQQYAAWQNAGGQGDFIPTQPQPGFGQALGTTSPALNSIGRF